MPPSPQRGEIWVAELDPTRGHEQAGRRPVLIVSVNPFNASPARLVYIAPLTRTDRGIPLHVSIVPPNGGLRAPSTVICDAVRSISIERLVAGQVTLWASRRGRLMASIFCTRCKRRRRTPMDRRA